MAVPKTTLRENELHKCPDGYEIERLEMVRIGRKDYEYISVEHELNLFVCTAIPPSTIHYYELVDNELVSISFANVLMMLKESKIAVEELRKPAISGYEMQYPNLPALPVRRPTKKVSSLFWRLGIWKEEWGEAPMSVAPTAKPPIEFERTIEKLGFWLTDWGIPPSMRGKKK